MGSGEEITLDESDIAALAELFELLARFDTEDKGRMAEETALLITEEGTPAMESTTQ